MQVLNHHLGGVCFIKGISVFVWWRILLPVSQLLDQSGRISLDFPRNMERISKIWSPCFLKWWKLFREWVEGGREAHASVIKLIEGSNLELAGRLFFLCTAPNCTIIWLTPSVAPAPRSFFMHPAHKSRGSWLAEGWSSWVDYAVQKGATRTTPNTWLSLLGRTEQFVPAMTEVFKAK